MPFQPSQPADPLQQLFMLQQLRAEQEKRAEEKQQRATNMALEWVQSGGSFRDVRDYLYEQGLTPSTERFVLGAEKLLKTKREQEVTGELTSPQYTNALAPAFARVANERGELSYSPEQQNGGLAQLQQQVIQRAALLGVPQAAGPALQQIQLAALGAEQGQREQVSRERRSEAADIRSQGRSAGIAAQARREAEAMQIRGERRATLAGDLEEFTKNAATASVADPGATPRLIAEATERFGVDEARRIEYRLANMTEGALASQELSRQERQQKRDLALAEGKTASPRIASLAAAGKAGYDPTTGFYYQGNDSLTETRQAALASLHEIQAQFEAAAKQFAKESGGKTYTGTLEEIKKQLGGNETPSFAAMDLLSTRYQQRLLRLESGAALTTQEVEQAKANAPSIVQMNVQGGQLVGAARVRFAAQREDLESMYLSRFDRIDRPAVREALRAASSERLRAIEADPESWYGEISKPTRAGQAALQELRQPASQPGAR